MNLAQHHPATYCSTTAIITANNHETDHIPLDTVFASCHTALTVPKRP